MSSALGTLRVIDLSENVAGQYCSRLLSDYGADVTLIEPTGGSCLRRMPPFDPAPPNESLLFFHLNLGKASLTLDTATPSGRAILMELAARADVVLVGAGFDRAELRTRNPRCIVAVISGFGEDGPYRDWKGTEMIYQAVSGMMNHNGVAEREPLYGCGQRASYAAGVAAYISVLTALIARERIGTGQEIAIDIAETAASMCYPFVTQYIYNGSLEPRGDRRQPLGQVECRDAWVAFWIHNHRWEAACHALDAPELLSDPRFADPGDRQDNWLELVAEIQARVRDWSSTELLRRWQSNQMVAAAACLPTQLVRDSDHLKARGFFETIETASGARTVLGPPFRMSATPRHVAGGPPAAGRDNSAVLAELGIVECEMGLLTRAAAI